MDLENQKIIQRNPNNDLKYFTEVGYKKENKNEDSEEDKDKDLPIEYITE